mgnify:CR=1 FL=1
MKKIKQLRTAQGLSQEKLAELLNVSRSAVAIWEVDGGTPDIDNLLQLSDAFEVSLDELVGNNDRKMKTKAEITNKENEDFKNHLYDIDLKGWNDGVFGVHIIAEDADLLYYQAKNKDNITYGMINKDYIKSLEAVKEIAQDKSAVEIERDFFLNKPVQINLAKHEGLIIGMLDFRDDDYQKVSIQSFEENTLHLQYGGTLNLNEITKIEIINE